MRVFSKTVILLAVIGFGGWIGFVAGAARKTASDEARSNEEDALYRSGERGGREQGKPLEDFEKLLKGEVDSDSIWKTVALLSLDEIQVGLRKIDEAWGSNRNTEIERIESALYYHWAELDPQGALDHLFANLRELEDPFLRFQALTESVLSGWMRRNPEVAFEAVKERPTCAMIARSMLVRTWRAEEVFERAAAYPEMERLLLESFTSLAAHDQGRRDVFLRLLDERQDVKWVDEMRASIFQSWAIDDFRGAIAEAEKRSLPDIEKLTDWAVLNQAREVIPWATERGMKMNGRSWEDGFQAWLIERPYEAREWLREQAPRWRNQGRWDMEVTFLARDLSGDSSAIGGGMPVGERRQVFWEALEAWRKRDSNSADDWLRTAPAAVQNVVSEEEGKAR